MEWIYSKEYTNNLYIVYDKLVSFYYDTSRVDDLAKAFVWDKTYQGPIYWRDLFNSLVDSVKGTYIEPHYRKSLQKLILSYEHHNDIPKTQFDMTTTETTVKAECEEMTKIEKAYNLLMDEFFKNMEKSLEEGEVDVAIYWYDQMIGLQDPNE
jgi:hypothetical protein